MGRTDDGGPSTPSRPSLLSLVILRNVLSDVIDGCNLLYTTR